VHDFARFHAAAAALASGCRSVQVTGRQTRLTADGRRPTADGKTVQVSSRRLPGSPRKVSVSRPVVDDTLTMIFVDLTGTEPDFHIARAQ
jgi:hypothetical protein